MMAEIHKWSSLHKSPLQEFYSEFTYNDHSSHYTYRAGENDKK